MTAQAQNDSLSLLPHPFIKVLQSVHDRNEILFYRILEDNFDEMAPIIYTPTVGWACSHFSQVYRQV